MGITPAAAAGNDRAELVQRARSCSQRSASASATASVVVCEVPQLAVQASGEDVDALLGTARRGRGGGRSRRGAVHTTHRLRRSRGATAGRRVRGRRRPICQAPSWRRSGRRSSRRRAVPTTPRLRRQPRCHSWPSSPRAKTSNLRGAQLATVGAEVKPPPSGSHDAQARVVARCHSWPSSPRAKTYQSARRPAGDGRGGGQAAAERFPRRPGSVVARGATADRRVQRAKTSNLPGAQLAAAGASASPPPNDCQLRGGARGHPVQLTTAGIGRIEERVTAAHQEELEIGGGLQPGGQCHRR